MGNRRLIDEDIIDFINDSPIEGEVPRAQNPFAGILMFDLWIFLTINYHFRRFIPIIMLAIKIFLTVSTVAGLLLFHLSTLSKSSTQLMISDESGNSSCALQQELDRLKSKTLSLELLVKRMSIQLKTACLESRGREDMLADFASESAGGSVISTPGTESFYGWGQFHATLFGIPIWRPNYFTPRKVIQPWSQAGECWAFRGTQGNIEIELAYLAYISRVTLEHIPLSASLTGSIDSAPREFRVLGQFRNKYVDLGTFVYNDRGAPSQTFKITREDVQKTPIKRVMLQIYSNWGNPDYTCIYRFRVHGKIFDNFENM